MQDAFATRKVAISASDLEIVRRDDPTPGHLPGSAGDRYTLKRVLATGGLGRVWIAFDHVLKRDVALKEVNTDLAGVAAIEEQFRREALITGRLEHPGIPPIYDMGRLPDGRPFYCMKLIDGHTLRHELVSLRRTATRSERHQKYLHLLAAFSAVCRTLAYAHARGVLHLDLKPENIVIGEYGATHVLDWGIAKLRISDREPAEVRRLKGAIGTPMYMPPEQHRGTEESLCPASDVYALGTVLAEIALARDAVELAPSDSAQSDAPSGSVGCNTIRQLHGPVRSICRRALAEDPKERYAGAHELGTDVERYIAGERMDSNKDGLLRASILWLRRGWPVAAAVTLLLATLGGWGADRYLRKEQARGLAHQAVQQAAGQWKSGRFENAVTILEAAAVQLAPDADDSTLRELQNHLLTLRNWRRFDHLLESVRGLTADPKRARDATELCDQAERLLTLKLSAPFVTENISANRLQSAEELRLIKNWLADGKTPSPTTSSERLPSIGSFFIKGRAAHLQGQWHTAIDHYKQSLAAAPDNFSAMYFLTVCLRRAERNDEAIMGYTACLANASHLSEQQLSALYAGRGDSALAAGDDNMALRDFEQAARLDAQDPRPLFNCGLVHFKLGYTVRAIECFSQALARDQQFTMARLHRARALRSLGDLDAATSDLERLLATDPESVETRVELALVHVQDRDLPAAEHALRRAGQLTHTFWMVHFVEGILAIEHKKYTEALDAFAAAEKQGGDRRLIQNHRALTYMAMGDFPSARQALDEVLRLKPDDQMARLHRAVTHAQSQQFADALDDLVRASRASVCADVLPATESYARLAVSAATASKSPEARRVATIAIEKLVALLNGADRTTRRRILDNPAFPPLLQSTEFAEKLRIALDESRNLGRVAN